MALFNVIHGPGAISKVLSSGFHNMHHVLTEYPLAEEGESKFDHSFVTTETLRLLPDLDPAVLEKYLAYLNRI